MIMNAIPPSFTPAGDGSLPGSGRAGFGQASASAMSMKWSALHDAADVIARLAGIASEAMRPQVRNFPAMIRDVGGWRRTMAEQGIDDLHAVITPGLAALLAVNARGTNPASAALALWQEFQAARAALLALSPPPSAMGPRRFT
jgi:hypothetical protein